MMPVQRSCDVETIGDFSRYYGNSWVGWHDEKLDYVKPCFVGGQIDGANVALRALVKTDSVDQFRIEPHFPASFDTLKNSIDFGVPDIGMMQDGPTILFFSYTTPRVAKKGYRSREAMTADFNSWDIRKKYNWKSNIMERYDFIWNAFNPQYFTLEQAEEKLSGGELVGIPISRTVGIYSSPRFKFSLLAYKRWTIGHVISPYLVQLKREYADYEEDIVRQTGAEVIVG